MSAGFLAWKPCSYNYNFYIRIGQIHVLQCLICNMISKKHALFPVLTDDSFQVGIGLHYDLDFKDELLSIFPLQLWSRTEPGSPDPYHHKLFNKLSIAGDDLYENTALP